MAPTPGAASVLKDKIAELAATLPPYAPLPPTDNPGRLAPKIRNMLKKIPSLLKNVRRSPYQALSGNARQQFFSEIERTRKTLRSILACIKPLNSKSTTLTGLSLALHGYTMTDKQTTHWKPKAMEDVSEALARTELYMATPRHNAAWQIELQAEVEHCMLSITKTTRELTSKILLIGGKPELNSRVAAHLMDLGADQVLTFEDATQTEQLLHEAEDQSSLRIFLPPLTGADGIGRIQKGVGNRPTIVVQGL